MKNREKKNIFVNFWKICMKSLYNEVERKRKLFLLTFDYNSYLGPILGQNTVQAPWFSMVWKCKSSWYLLASGGFWWLVVMEVSCYPGRHWRTEAGVTLGMEAVRKIQAERLAWSCYAFLHWQLANHLPPSSLFCPPTLLPSSHLETF